MWPFSEGPHKKKVKTMEEAYCMKYDRLKNPNSVIRVKRR